MAFVMSPHSVGDAGGLQVRLNGKPMVRSDPPEVRTLIINKTGFQILDTKPAA